MLVLKFTNKKAKQNKNKSTIIYIFYIAGPNCEIKGHIIPQGGNSTTNGQLCECRQGGDSHSALVICSRCFDLNFGGVGKRSCG